MKKLGFANKSAVYLKLRRMKLSEQAESALAYIQNIKVDETLNPWKQEGLFTKNSYRWLEKKKLFSKLVRKN